MATAHKMKRSTKKSRSADRRPAGRSRTTKRAAKQRASSRGSSRRSSRMGRRSSPGASSKLKYSKWVDSPEDHEERNGQSLATRNHDVIRQWAGARRAVPTVAGNTKSSDGAGVLRMDFPGYGGKRLKKIDWDEWFDTFDKRNLVFLYQEHKRDGSMSNFFKLNSQRS
ncbi:MAG TPA: hypothetical protein VFS39_03450 [Nitrospira sp.]|nr:hypothetical protein [Nitrospira sp.]